MCIFCMAALVMIGASLSAVVLGNMENQLVSTKGVSQVRRSVDTESTVMWQANVMIRVPNRPVKEVPIAVHLYKQYKRMRIQILTHGISQAEAEAVQDVICQAFEARVISRHFPSEAAFAENDSQQQVPQRQTADPRKTQQESQERLRLK
jgi:hypothetical protein